jgi:DMSO/TMAO reductase YedYZ molybdopterin-dependent catalytic subunit
MIAGLASAQKPEISDFDFSLLDESTVPGELFFVREHFPAPRVSSADWKLAISGAVARPSEFSYEQVSSRPIRNLPVTLECAENPVGGGLVSHAEWRGVTLGSLLAEAQPAADATYLRLSGADGFSRTLPVAKGMHADTIIALRMNDEKLPVNHGFPMRAIVPGWYGMDSVKWLNRVEVLRGEDTSRDYQRLNRSFLAGARPAGPVTAMNVKSEFARPLDGAVLQGRRLLLRGAAWAGENRVRMVEVSTDGRKSWQAARLLSPPIPYAWVQWTCEWKIPGPGEYNLAVRASDDAGRTQPQSRAAERADSYELNVWQSIGVVVT